MTFKVITIGEALWDVFPDGRRLGGAPANVAVHCAAMGTTAAIVTRLGRDSLGREAAEQLRARTVSGELLQWDERHSTGTVDVVPASGGHQFRIHENAAWDWIEDNEQSGQAIRGAGAVCLGTLARRTPHARAAIHQLASHAGSQAIRLLDINLRPPFYTKELIEESLLWANALKLNDEELACLMSLYSLPKEPQEAIELLADRFELSFIGLTRGAAGSLLFKSGQWSLRTPGKGVVVDTVGAGDGFTAAMLTAVLHGAALPDVHEFAADVAAFVCSQPGATPALPNSLAHRFTRLGR